MDFENRVWLTTGTPPPHRTPRELDDINIRNVLKMIRSQVYPNHSDIGRYDYVEWATQGGGDEWFQENRRIYKHGQIATNL